ncbi:MAG: PUA domain-containing protein [Candidatus Nitrosocaldus sp.]
MREYHLSKSDIDAVMQRIKDRWPKHISMGMKRPKTLRIIEMDDGSIDDNSILVGDDIILVVKDGIILPFLSMQLLGSLPSVKVDMGAVKHVCNGASVMRPGIVSMDEFEKDSIVAVKDERYGKCIAVGIASVSSDDARSMSKGVIIDNKHYIGDRFWNECKRRGML